MKKRLTMKVSLNIDISEVMDLSTEVGRKDYEEFQEGFLFGQENREEALKVLQKELEDTLDVNEGGLEVTNFELVEEDINE